MSSESHSPMSARGRETNESPGSTDGVNVNAERAGALPPAVDELLRFFSVLSHDLKSPMFSIDGFSELLSSDYSDRLDDDGRDFLQRIRSSIKQMKRVLDDMSQILKLLSRPNAARRLELREIVEELRLRYNYLIENEGVEVRTPNDLPAVEADREKVCEALGALISNALTFNDRAPNERTLDISCEPEGSMWKLCVADNGMGIDPRYLQQMFDLGTKLDKSRGGGPGYGLFLARRIVQSHGGELTAESKPGEGSRFCMTLPATSTG